MKFAKDIFYASVLQWCMCGFRENAFVAHLGGKKSEWSLIHVPLCFAGETLLASSHSGGKGSGEGWPHSSSFAWITSVESISAFLHVTWLPGSQTTYCSLCWFGLLWGSSASYMGTSKPSKTSVCPDAVESLTLELYVKTLESADSSKNIIIPFFLL